MAQMPAIRGRDGSRAIIQSTRLRIATLVIAMGLFYCTAALAGSVDVGFVDDAGLDQWIAGEPVVASKEETSCIPAKFDENSTCGAVTIFNHSAQTIKVSCTSSNEEFRIDPGGAIRVLSSGDDALPCSSLKDHDYIRPGARCYVRIGFWPRTGEVRHATIQVAVKGTGGSTTTYFKVKGTSDYPPELRAAEEVRQRHAAELSKIPGVASVELDNKGGIKIDVTVKDEDDIDHVQRQIPPKIEGYDTEVTRYDEHASDL